MRSILFAAALTVATAATAQADEGVHLLSGWAKASHPAAFKVNKNGVAYITIENTGTEVDTIVKLSSPKARVTEVHEMGADEKGMPFMRKVKDLTFDPGEKMEMHPGGIHLMLIDMPEPLKEGEILPVTVTFEHAGDETIELKVYPFRSKGPDAEAAK